MHQQILLAWHIHWLHQSEHKLSENSLAAAALLPFFLLSLATSIILLMTVQ
jgi:hypothetical protein